MTDMQQIAETMATDFMRAVNAATKAQEATVDDLLRQMDEAEADRQEGNAKVRKMREDAARILAESLKVEETTEAAFSARRREITAQLNELRMMRATAPMIGHNSERAAA